jgi:dolichol-phosphate mannosyltransferase
MKLVFILPTFNERENIVSLLTQLADVTRGIKHHTISYLVVDDHSPDGTEDEVAKYQKTHKNVFIISKEKEGLGKALLKGMEYAVETLHADIIFHMDADLSHDPKKVPEFIRLLDKGADFVIGSRYIPGGSIPPNWGIHRKSFSRIGNAIVRFGLGYPQVHDWTGGFRVFHKKYYELLRTEVAPYKGYVFQIAFLHRAILKGANVVEVPFGFTDRRYGRSKIAPFEYIRNVLLYVGVSRMAELRKGPFGKMLVVGAIGFVINTVILELGVALGFDPAIGSAVGAEVAIVSNFILNNTWTFRDRRIVGTRLVGKFFQFNLTSLGAIIIQAGTVFIGTRLFGHGVYRLFYMIGVGIGLVWNFTMYAKVIWKSTK